LHIAARRGDIRAVQLLVKGGLDVNRQGDMGYTPLHCAKNQDIFAFLIGSGALTSIENSFGKLPNVR